MVHSVYSGIRRLYFRLFITFLFISIVFFAGYLFAIQDQGIKSKSFSAEKIHRLVKTENSNEISLIGSGRCCRNFIPDIITKNCYNYGIENADFDLLYLMLKHELDEKNNLPVILSFDFDLYNSDSGNEISTLGNSSGNIDDYLVNKFGYLYSFNNISYLNQFDRCLQNCFVENSNLDYFSGGGFFSKAAFKQEEFNKCTKKRTSTLHTFFMDKRKSELFSALIKNHPDKKCILVISPYHSSYFKSFVGYTNAIIYIESLKVNQNLYVIDFSELNYPDSLFLNTTCLNYNGARRFSSDLKQQLRAIDPVFE